MKIPESIELSGSRVEGKNIKTIFWQSGGHSLKVVFYNGSPLYLTGDEAVEAENYFTQYRNMKR